MKRHTAHRNMTCFQKPAVRAVTVITVNCSASGLTAPARFKDKLQDYDWDGYYDIIRRLQPEREGMPARLLNKDRGQFYEAASEELPTIESSSERGKRNTIW